MGLTQMYNEGWLAMRNMPVDGDISLEPKPVFTVVVMATAPCCESTMEMWDVP